MRACGPARRRPGAGSAGAGAGIAGAAGGLASRIDALADRGRAGRDGAGSSGSAAGPTGDQAATQEFDVAGNGHADGPGRGRLVLDPGDPVEAWWLPSSMADPVEVPPVAAGWAEVAASAGTGRIPAAAPVPGPGPGPGRGPAGAAATPWSPAWPAAWTGSPARSGPPGRGSPRW